MTTNTTTYNKNNNSQLSTLNSTMPEENVVVVSIEDEELLFDTSPVQRQRHQAWSPMGSQKKSLALVSGGFDDMDLPQVKQVKKNKANEGLKRNTQMPKQRYNHFESNSNKINEEEDVDSESSDSSRVINRKANISKKTSSKSHRSKSRKAGRKPKQHQLSDFEREVLASNPKVCKLLGLDSTGTDMGLASSSRSRARFSLSRSSSFAGPSSSGSSTSSTNARLLRSRRSSFVESTKTLLRKVSMSNF